MKCKYCDRPAVTPATGMCVACFPIAWELEEFVNRSPEARAFVEGILLKTISPSAYYRDDYGDDRVCVCGHKYYRHFDTYDDMYPIGCKYCDCCTFKEAKE